MGYDIPGVGSSATGIVTLYNPMFVGIVHLVSTTHTETLPKASESVGKFMTFKKTDGITTTVTIDGYGSETIDGSTTQTLVDENEVLRIYCDGTEWHIV